MPIVGVLPASRGAGALAAAGDAPDVTTSAAGAPLAGGEAGPTRASVDTTTGEAAGGAFAREAAAGIAAGEASAGAASVVRVLSRRAILGSSMSSPAGVAARATADVATKIRQAHAARLIASNAISFQLLGRS